MTTVNLSGTWSEKQRPNNGLERVAGYVHGNRLARIPVVGYIEFHQYTEKLTGNVLTVSIPAIEPALNGDGTDPTGAGEQIFQILDQLRREHGKGSVADTLFSVAPGSFDDDVPDGRPAEQLDGQQEMRFGPDGEHEVPPPSAEEIMAERAEAKAAEADPAEPPATPGRKAKPSTTPFEPGPGDAA